MIRFPDGSWGVVDSNTPQGFREPPALTLLKENGVTALSFVCLTHPHRDHYTGLLRILEAFDRHVEEIWMFPIDSVHIKRFLILQHQKNQTTERGRARFSELRGIFEAFHRLERKNSARALYGGMSVPARGGVQIDCLGPLRRDIGQYQGQMVRSLERSRYDLDDNLISVVLRLTYGSSSVLLASDAPKLAWPQMLREQVRRASGLRARAVKVGHHGSKDGHHSEIWKKVVDPQGTDAAISAGVGHGHPSREVLESLCGLGVRLHCTNFPDHCLARRNHDLSKFEGLPDTAKVPLLMLDRYSNLPTIRCNGDIRVDVTNDGQCRVTHESEEFCPLHIPRPQAVAVGVP